ncbi:outer membrane protein [Breoghania sp. L-A4]|uniref:outer membrane protein n=1 Tax=Breoghania sp. L-A4 TaxID=2304600 RepID=UPI000E3593BC|nr:outer membrane protein [Breoghania sp. L-A4]AXS41769.1 porin family protein [Breoghania sp. L-A4]
MNRIIKSALAAGFAASLMGGTALAADYSAPSIVTVASTWTGLYGGLNGGFGWGNSYHIDTAGTRSSDFDISGGLIGATVGYNWQADNIVFGLEADWGFANIEGSTTGGCAPGCSTEIQSFGTLRPRIGWAFGNFLPYVTGGLAWGLIESGQPGFTNSGWEVGWTVGAGVEAKFTPNLSVKAEYLYADLGDGGYTVAIPVAAKVNDLSIVRVGLNYHVDWFSGGY